MECLVSSVIASAKMKIHILIVFLQLGAVYSSSSGCDIGHKNDEKAELSRQFPGSWWTVGAQGTKRESRELPKHVL